MKHDRGIPENRVWKNSRRIFPNAGSIGNPKEWRVIPWGRERPIDSDIINTASSRQKSGRVKDRRAPRKELHLQSCLSEILAVEMEFRARARWMAYTHFCFKVKLVIIGLVVGDKFGWLSRWDFLSANLCLIIISLWFLLTRFTRTVYLIEITIVDRVEPKSISSNLISPISDNWVWDGC